MGKRAAVQGWPFALVHAYAANMNHRQYSITHFLIMISERLSGWGGKYSVNGGIGKDFYSAFS